MAEFFHMGGYAFFVWSSYAIVFIAFVYAFVSPLLHHQRVLTELRKSTQTERKTKVVATQSPAATPD
ncbi:MAG: heme exporter protein CcmD [Acidiferrobacterales bacterium]|nr:heme exporter protein CcmD [Acidiferrobacterales bacterium]